jgi:hypothetical protein
MSTPLALSRLHMLFMILRCALLRLLQHEIMNSDYCFSVNLSRRCFPCLQMGWEGGGVKDMTQKMTPFSDFFCAPHVLKNDHPGCCNVRHDAAHKA